MNKEQSMNVSQGHWVLAKLGKRVLRPGGKELTVKMIEELEISQDDDVVEFAPGLGFTAQMTLNKKPKSYTGIELNEEAVCFLKTKLVGDNFKIIVGNASNTNLNAESVDKVYGEAMLTMQADHRKSEIIREAYRILRKGGLYAIHELGLVPNDIQSGVKAEIQKELAKSIKVNARPLTCKEWSTLLENEGFEIIRIETNPMHLLEIKRMIDDEGIIRTLKIIFNILTNSEARKRVLNMRSIFRRYEQNLNAIAIIARKK